MASKRGFGTIEKLPSGRFRAKYLGPDGARHPAPRTFTAKADAEGWLAAERKLTEVPEGWIPPRLRAEAARKAAQVAEATGMPTFSDYARRWIAERKVKGQPLADRTRDHYNRLLDSYLLPTFGATPLDCITPAAVNVWYDQLATVKKKHHGRKVEGRTSKAHTYALARAIMNTAVSVHGPLVGHGNPFAVRGGGSSPSRKRTELVTSSELETILATIRPDWRLMVLLALWTGLRYSELAELRRSDLDLRNQVIRVRRSVSRSSETGVRVKSTKSEAGLRDMHIPDAILADVTAHLHARVAGRDGLLFPGGTGAHLAPATFYGKAGGSGWYAARAAAARQDLHFHDLRATGATLLAQQGATEAEVQAFLGDSTPQAAQRYVRAARSRMKALTGKLSELADGGEW